MLARWAPKNAFFEFFLREVLTTPPPGSPHIPQRWRPQPPARPERLHNTGLAKTRAGKYQGRPCTSTHARTLGTLHPSALDTRQTARGRSYRRRALEGGWNVSETVQIWTQRSGSKKYLICEYICCIRNAKPLYSVSKV